MRLNGNDASHPQIDDSQQEQTDNLTGSRLTSKCGDAAEMQRRPHLVTHRDLPMSLLPDLQHSLLAATLGQKAAEKPTASEWPQPAVIRLQ